MADSSPRLRPARELDAATVADLIYETAGGMYEVYGGTRAGALRTLSAAFARSGTSASRETISIAELSDRVVGAMASFPAAEQKRREIAFLRLTLLRSAFWKWPGIARLHRLGATAMPAFPDDALYIDALATRAESRRRGVATALLHEAERQARARGLGAVAVDTAATNRPAQALYERAGFRVTQRRAPARGLPGVIGYLRPL